MGTPKALVGQMDISDAYAFCQDITKREARNFYYAFVTLPREQRQAIFAVYAFSRIADDIADGAGGGADKARRLDRLHELVDESLASRSSDPVFLALADASRRFDIPKNLFHEIIEGVEFDLFKNRYESFEELRSYCYKVAGVVGLVCIQIFGCDDPKGKELAVDLGIAMQLTNIIRDIKEDFARDRVYVPQNELAQFGYTEADIAGNVMNDHFVGLMRFQCLRAREHFESGALLFPLLTKNSRSCAIGLHHLYSRLLSIIENRNFDVFDRRVTVPTWEKLLMTIRLMVMGGMPWKSGQ